MAEAGADGTFVVENLPPGEAELHLIAWNSDAAPLDLRLMIPDEPKTTEHAISLFPPDWSSPAVSSTGRPARGSSMPSWSIVRGPSRAGSPATSLSGPSRRQTAASDWSCRPAREASKY